MLRVPFPIVCVALCACSPLVLQVAPDAPGDPPDPGLVVAGPDGRPTCDHPFPSGADAARVGVVCGPWDVAWADGAQFPSLQEAIDAAPAGGTVLVCPGVHGRGVDIVRKDLQLSSVSGSAADTTLSEPGAILRIEDSEVSVSDLTFAGGIGDVSGGAIHQEGRSLRLERVVFDANTGLFGGAVWFGGRALVVEQSTFTGNRANGSGGAVHVDEAECASFVDSTFVGNEADGYGGALNVFDAEDVLSVGSTFEGSSAGRGGGAIRQHAGWLAVYGSTFRGNRADFDGGSVLLDAPEVVGLQVTGTTFEGGTAGSDGGAISLQGPGHKALGVSDTTFTGNVADDAGGAISTFCAGRLDAAIDRVAFSDGSAAEGGAVRLGGRGSVYATLDGASFDGNVADPDSAALVVEPGGALELRSVDFGTTAPNAPADLVTPCGGGAVGGAEVSLTCRDRQWSAP